MCRGVASGGSRARRKGRMDTALAIMDETCPDVRRPRTSVAPIGRHERHAASTRQTGQILAITSGKGGVGKSNVAAGLAIMLSAAGMNVALVDGDIGLGNLDVLMGVSPGPSVADVMSGRRAIEDVLVKLPCGVHLAGGGAGAWAAGDSRNLPLADLLDGLARLRQRHDFVIVDCGGGIGHPVRQFCSAADHVLMVTTPEPTAVTDAYGLLKTLHMQNTPARMSLLVNSAVDRAEARATYERINSVSSAFLGRQIYDAGFIPADRAVPEAVRRRRPFVLASPRCPATRALAALAVKLHPKVLAARTPQVGFLGRVAQWLS